MILWRGMSSGGFPTPLLRPAADPPSPPEFHLTPAALRLPTLSSPLEPRLPRSSPASTTFFASPPFLPVAPAEQSQRPQELRQHEDEDAEVEAAAWRMNAAAPFLFRAAPDAAASEAAAAAGRMSASIITRGRDRTPLTRARSCSWTRSTRSPTPDRSLPMRAASSTLVSGAYSHRFPDRFRSTHHFPVLSNRSSISSNSSSVSSGGGLFEPHTNSSGHRGIAAAATETAAVSVLPAAGRVDASLRTEGGIGELGFTGPTAAKSTAGALLKTSVEEKGRRDITAAADFPNSAPAMGTKSMLLPLSYEAASKLLGDAQSPSSRGSVSSIHTCSTRSSASGPAVSDELDRTLLLSMVQQQHVGQRQQCMQQQQNAHLLQQLQQQQTRGVLGKEVGSRATDGTRLAGGAAAAGLSRGGDPADLTPTVAAAGRASGLGGIALTEGSRGRGGAAAAGGSVKGVGEEAAVEECVRRLLPHPFIGLSPAAQRGMPDEKEAAGIFERIWADVLRREAAQQQAVAPMLESTRAAAAVATAGEDRRLRSTTVREDNEEGEQQQQQERQQQQPVLLRAGAEQKT